MKKIKSIILVFATLFILSCEKDSTQGVSKVTNYPTITINGDITMVLTQGDTYTEQSAQALAGSQVLPLETEGTVNTSIPGVYKVRYSATNDDGFPASKERTVIVLSNQPSNINLEGVFVRSGNINNVTKLADRKYVCDNATGYTTGNENNLTLTFYNIDDTKMYAAYQENASATGISAESNIGTITNANKFSWVIYASGFFGTAVRTFNRQ